uniref:Uncharacterized protein n=1 Tax=Rhizophora mucronata TaxID=61149 RepID=A0A2P2PG25_RHIMU
MLVVVQLVSFLMMRLI